MYWKTCCVLASTSLLLGCQFEKTPSNDNPTLTQELWIKSWTPQKVRLTCGASSCPPGIGVLIGTGPVLADDKFRIWICTNSLVSDHEVISAGHCDFFKKGATAVYSFLLTKKQTLEIHRVKKAIISTNEQLDPLALDLGLFELEGTVARESMTPFTLSRKYNTAMKRFKTFVVNAGTSETANVAENFEIDVRECTVRAQTEYFPFDLSERPQTFLGSDCLIVHGNSGSPVFEDTDLTTIEGIVQSADSEARNGGSNRLRNIARPPALTLNVPKDRNTDWTVATSVACMPLPGWAPGEPSCMKTTYGVWTLRSLQMLNSSFLTAIEIWMKDQATDERYPFEAGPILVPAKPISGLRSQNNQYYFFQKPLCLKPGQSILSQRQFQAAVRLYQARIENQTVVIEPNPLHTMTSKLSLNPVALDTFNYQLNEFSSDQDYGIDLLQPSIASLISQLKRGVQLRLPNCSQKDQELFRKSLQFVTWNATTEP